MAYTLDLRSSAARLVGSTPTPGTMKLLNKIAIVTGGTSGIGKAIAKKFLAEGAKVVVGAPDKDKFPGIEKELPGIVCIATDVRSEDDVKNLISKTAEQFGQIDIVVNNAGVSHQEDFLGTDLDEYRKIMDINLTGTFLMMKHAIPHLLKTKGNIINLGSRLSFIVDTDVPIYSTSKAAVAMLTKNTAVAFAPKGIRINCLCPGSVDTPLLESYFKTRQEMLDYYAQHNLMGRLGTAEEVANVAAFLASDEASYVTGAMWQVDGGGWLMGN